MNWARSSAGEEIVKGKSRIVGPGLAAKVVILIGKGAVYIFPVILYRVSLIVV